MGREWSLITGRGYKTVGGGGGGPVKFYPFEKGGGLKSFSHTEGGGAKRFHLQKGGGGTISFNLS